MTRFPGRLHSVAPGWGTGRDLVVIADRLRGLMPERARVASVGSWGTLYPSYLLNLSYWGEPKPDANAANVIAKVRKLMLVSMAVTVIAVGSVFGFIGYRIFKSDGTTAKTADKLPEASAIPADMTLALPRGARVIQSAVAGDRLVITLDIDGKIEVRTFDVNTLQPAGRLNFSGTP